LEEESELVDSKKIVVGGFSQGGAMNMLVGYTFEKPLAGVASCSAYLLLAEECMYGFGDIMMTRNTKIIEKIINNSFSS
jgi:predicted esterase